MLNPRCAEVPSAVPVSTVLVGESLSLAIHAPCRKCSPSFFKVAIENARDRGNLGPPGVDSATKEPTGRSTASRRRGNTAASIWVSGRSLACTRFG
jgi:hypothetical protein